MSTRDQSLPEYERPPVVEVALAIQLEAAIGYRSLDLANIARHWANEFPKIEERHPLPKMGFGSESLDMTFDVSDETETPRLWLQNDAGDRVVQLQQDRIVVNWKRGTGDDTYPRYASIREALRDAWQRMTAAVIELGFDMPQPSICEAQYINHLGADQGWHSTEDTARLIAPWNGTMSDDFLPTDHHGALLLHFHIPNQPGWLDINGWTTDLDDGEKMLVLNLTSQGEATSPDIAGALKFMDLAHEWIVKGFTSVTTTEAHEKWGKAK